MSKTLKALLLVSFAVILCFGIGACSKTNSDITDNDDWNGHPDIVQKGKDMLHTALISYDSQAAAKDMDYENSPYYLSLNGTWDFTLATRSDNVPANFYTSKFVYPDRSAPVDPLNKAVILYWDSITVPGSWELQGYENPVYTRTRYAWGAEVIPPRVPANYNPIGLYRREIEIPADWDGREVFISLEGVSSACYIYVNGEIAGYGQDSFTTKDFRITDWVEYGKTNLIALKVIKFSDGSWLEASDSLKLGGIFRDVYLYSSPKVQIKDVFIGTQFDEDMVNAMMLTEVKVAAYEDKAPVGYTLNITLFDQNGDQFISKILGSPLKFESNQSGGAFMVKGGANVPVTAPILWNAENPYLYTAVVSLMDDKDNVLDIVSLKYGFRTAEFLTDDLGNQTFIVNGEPITFFGVIYNEHSADTGLTLSEEEMIADIVNLKSMNVNAIRSPGQPISSKFLALCDQYGMYVIDDMSLTSTPFSNKGDQSVPGNQTIWQKAIIDRVINVKERDKNNASVIMWAIGNQSGSGESFKTLKNYLQSNDKRLIIYDGQSAVSDLVTGVEWSFDQIMTYLGDVGNKKPLILESFNKSYLNGGGNIDAYVNIFTADNSLQGGFFAQYIDKAIWYPIKVDNAKDTIQNYPRSENPELYRLSYSGSWGDAINEGATGLTGLLNADRTFKSAAEQFKRAYSPIYIQAVDVKSGIFEISNRNTFNNYQDNYKIEYVIYAEDKEVSKGTVDGLTLNPGESKNITINYGTIEANKDYFVDIFVKYKNNPTWAGNDYVVWSGQYDITAFGVMPKTSTSSPAGQMLNVVVFDKPVIATTLIDIALGNFYITNNSLYNTNEAWSLSYEIFEKNNFDKEPKFLSIDKGSLSLDVEAEQKYVKINIPYYVNAVENGEYYINVVLTTTKAIGDVPAGYKVEYTYDQYSLGGRIPFKIDLTRTPPPIEYDDETGWPIDPETGLPVDPEITKAEEAAAAEAAAAQKLLDDAAAAEEAAKNPPVEEEEFIPEPEFEPFISIKNNKVDLLIDSKTGMIMKYAIDGVDIFAPTDVFTPSYPDEIIASPVANLYRMPTGGDVSAADAIAQSNIEKMLDLSLTAERKVLENGIKVEQISDTHLKLTLDYIWAAYPYSLFRAYALDNTYSVIYDIFANGEIVISAAYQPTLHAGIPFELSNIITLAEGMQQMSWYGRGPGESYPDKLADSRVSVYNNININDQIIDYLSSTSSSDKSDVRWVTFKNADGNGIMISSDTNNFALNVSRAYPWDNTSVSKTFDRAETMVRIIAKQRGVSAGNMSDAQYLNANAYVDPGKTFTFSYKITPITASTDPMAASKQKLDVQLPQTVSKLLNNGSVYVLQNSTNSSEYLSSTTNGLSLKEGFGSDNQRWLVTADTENGVANAYKYFNVGKKLYLTPFTNIRSRDTAGIGPSVELGLGEHMMNNWQSWVEDQNGELQPADVNYSAHAMGNEGQVSMGSRIALVRKSGRNEAVWLKQAIEGVEDTYVLRNMQTGYYMTVADKITFRTPIVAKQNSILREYPVDFDWTDYDKLAEEAPAYDYYVFGDWIPATNYLVQWQLLPSDMQRWTFTEVNPGEYRLTNRSTYLVLDASNNTLTETENNNSDSQLWKVTEDGGLFIFTNKASGKVLDSYVLSVPMTQQEMDLEYITDESLAFKYVNTLTLTDWRNMPSQKWSVQSSTDLQVSVEAGEEWFTTRFPDEDRDEE